MFSILKTPDGMDDVDQLAFVLAMLSAGRRWRAVSLDPR
jgi:hypothetical protein